MKYAQLARGFDWRLPNMLACCKCKSRPLLPYDSQIQGLMFLADECNRVSKKTLLLIAGMSLWKRAFVNSLSKYLNIENDKKSYFLEYNMDYFTSPLYSINWFILLFDKRWNFYAWKWKNNIIPFILIFNSPRLVVHEGKE